MFHCRNVPIIRETNFSLLFLESQLGKIDAKYDIQQNLDVEQVRRNFEGKISHLRGEIEEDIYNDYCRKVICWCFPKFVYMFDHFIGMMTWIDYSFFKLCLIFFSFCRKSDWFWLYFEKEHLIL